MSAYQTSYQTELPKTGNPYPGENAFAYEDPETYHEPIPFSFDEVQEQNSAKSPKLLQFQEIIKSCVASLKAIYIHQKEKTMSKEGPSLIRFLCFLGGFFMSITSAVYALNFFLLFHNPYMYLLHYFEGFFGILIMIVEAKNWDCIDQFKPWASEWFKFITNPVGKAGFYLFLGIIVTVLKSSVINLILGLYMSFLGIVCLAIYSGRKTVIYEEDFKNDNQRAMMSLLSEVGQESTTADDYRYPIFQGEPQCSY